MSVRRACVTTATLLTTGLLAFGAAPLGAEAASHAPDAPAMSTSALVTVPDVVDRTGNSAAALLTAAGLTYELHGTGGFVKAQFPRAGARVAAGTTVDLEMQTVRH